MDFCFDRVACLNIRRSLRKEWVLTNGTGDYASSTVPYCNTRKYHGLLVANLGSPEGRHVLLSTTEDSIVGGGKEFFFSTRKHPNVYFPRGHENLHSTTVGDWPVFTYRVGDSTITRELVLVRGRTLLLFKYTFSSTAALPPVALRVKPLLAFRHFHSLGYANDDITAHAVPCRQGVQVHPYEAMPSLFMQVKGDFEFFPTADWCRNVEYITEQERGFPHSEDLFMPGMFEIPLTPDKPIYLAVSTTEVSDNLEELWEHETSQRVTLCQASDNILGHFVRRAADFMITSPRGTLSVLAGYHWFDAWGRDTCIALPGLTFCAGRLTKGVRILEAVGKTLHNGLIPNCIGEEHSAHAFNSVDASLWYIWAVQKLLHHLPDHEDWVREQAWPVIRQIVDAYRDGTNPSIYMDEEGLLHAGTVDTQLTWMDAQANGKPVTPRHGCPVEINALWYNALAFADYLGERFGDKKYVCTALLRQVRVNFRKRFWVDRHGGYLGDVWCDGKLDTSIRPNQIFAVSLPYPVLEDDYQPFVVECVRNHLLTPYGLRTLSPDHADYRPIYHGGPEERDSAYHQGTVWPWLLGHYTEALLRTAWDTEGAVRALLDTVRPLFTTHLYDAGVGSISEVFDGSPPHQPGGCVSQAWSVAECVRVLRLSQMAAPEVYAEWESSISEGR